MKSLICLHILDESLREQNLKDNFVFCCLQVDVFSFGIVLWEILTGEEPYINMHCGAIIGKLTSNLCVFEISACNYYCAWELKTMFMLNVEAFAGNDSSILT